MSDDSSTERARLLDALDHEIVRHISSRHSDGLTFWALLGALGSVLWTMLSDVTGSQMLAHPSQLLLLLLAVSVAGDALSWSVTILKGEWAGPAEPRRPRVIAASNYFGRFITRLATAYTLVRNVLLMGLLLTVASSALSTWVVCSAITLYVVQSAFLVLSLVVSYTAFSITVGVSSRVASIGSRVVVVLVYLAQVTVAYTVCSQLWKVLATSTWAEYRFTALAAIGIWLCGRLANREPQQRVLESLENTRQALGFDWITPAEARTEYERAVVGEDAEAKMGEVLKGVAALFQPLHEGDRRMASEATELAHRLASSEGEVSELEDKEIGAALNRATAWGSERKVTLETARLGLKRIRRQLIRLTHSQSREADARCNEEVSRILQESLRLSQEAGNTLTNLIATANAKGYASRAKAPAATDERA